jgi:hypothetical protein
MSRHLTDRQQLTAQCPPLMTSFTKNVVADPAVYDVWQFHAFLLCGLIEEELAKLDGFDT